MSSWLAKWWIAGGLILSGSAGALADAPYVPPAPEVVAFRRDRLPLDPDSIGELSQQLLVLARNQGGAQPADRRTVAQMLATAGMLTPGDPKLTAFGERFASGERTPAGDPDAVATARSRVWQALNWLGAKEAGDDARTLGACLADIMVAADPKHPNARELAAKGERGPWDGWVKPLDAFKAPDPVAVKDPDPPAPPDPPKTGDKPDDSDPSASPVKLAKARLQSVVWAQLVRDQPRKLTVVPFTMEAGARSATEEQENDEGSSGNDGNHREPEAFSCRWENPKAGDQEWEEKDRFRPLREAIQTAVKEANGRLPNDVRMTVRAETQASYRVAKDPAGLSAPLAVLMHAMSSGIEPAGTVIGEITRDGAFKAPPDFWQRLRHLSGKTVGRLIVPADAEPFLSAILVLEEPGFFLDNEVVFAANLEEVLEFTALAPAGRLAEPSARFLEIRSKRGNQPPGAYVANRFIRTRLEEIARATPCHASARMLAIQGSGQRPTRLTPQLLATELLALTATTAPFVNYNDDPNDLDSETMLNVSEAGKTKAEALMRYAEMRDRALVDQVNDLMVGLRTFARALRKRTDTNGNHISHWDDFRSFKELNERVTTALKLAAGTPP
jgi:hypothetical protein